MRIAALLILAAIGAVGCTEGMGLVSEPSAGEYSLVRVGDQALPATVPTSSGVGVQVAAGKLVLDAAGGFTLDLGSGYKTASYGGYGYSGTVASCSGQYEPTGAFVAFRAVGTGECSPTFSGSGSVGPGALRIDYHGAILVFQRISSR